MFKLFVTSRVPADVLDELEENFQLEYHDSEQPLTKEELTKKCPDAQAILCPLSDKIDGEIMDSKPELKIIANFGAGFDNINLEEATKRGIVVTNAPAKSSAISTAEFTFGLILALSRKIVSGDALTRRGDFEKYSWRPTFYLGHELKGKTLGIIGLGNIGKNLARFANAFEMDVIYWNRTRLDEEHEAELGVKYFKIDEILKTADFVTLHTAYAQELHHLIDEEALDKMKDTAYLINAARGPLVKEEALIKALKDNKIAGAALDVYEFEPKISSEFFEMENIILAPHLGNATFEARNEMGILAFKNILAVSKNEEAPNQVN